MNERITPVTRATEIRHVTARRANSVTVRPGTGEYQRQYALPLAFGYVTTVMLRSQRLVTKADISHIGEKMRAQIWRHY